MAAWQPTNIFLMCPVQLWKLVCQPGAWLQKATSDVAVDVAFDLDLDLLLIFRPFGRPSVGVHQGVRRVAPCGEAAHIERRSSRSRPEAMPPDGHRSEGTRSLSEAPYAGAKPFGSFLAFEKGTRCKSETIISRYRSNGYALAIKYHTCECFIIHWLPIPLRLTKHNVASIVRPFQTPIG
jgi:hypothetical protein